VGVFKKGKNNSNLDRKIARLDEDLKKTGVVRESSSTSMSGNDKTKDVQMITEHVKSDWRSGYKKEEISKEDVLQEEINAVRNKKNSLRKVDGYIASIDESYNQLKNDIFQELSEDFLHNIPALERKINQVLEIYNHIEEGLLNQPPETPTEDPLTPLDQQFITAEDLDAHYKLFINRIQEQIATIGGGGEVRLKWLDDIVGIATNASAYDGQFLKYDHSIEKFVFETVSGVGTGSQGIQGTTGSQGIQGIQGPSGVGGGGTGYFEQTAAGIHTTSSVGIGTTADSAYSLLVEGDARVTGILTVGPSSVTIDGINNEVTIGTGVTIYGNTGIVSATSIYAAGSLLTGAQGTQGVQGTTGGQGTQGIQGTVGSFGGATFDYTFNAGITSSVVKNLTSLATSGATILNVPDLTGLISGAPVEGQSIASGAVISSFPTSTSVEISVGITSDIGSGDPVTFVQTGQGQLRLNQTGISTATEMYINDADDNGTDIQSYLRTIDDSTSTIKGHFKVSNKLNADDFALFTISSISEGTGYFLVNTAFVSGAATSFSASEDVLVTFARTGDKGDTGAQGATGAQGTQGITGAGTQGATGIQGTQGINGPQGRQGLQGIQGSGGTQGLKGDDGLQGSQGITGAGTQGTQGIQGTQASQGIQGIQGESIQGSQGTQGDIGGTGPQGTQGIQGSDATVQGIQGTQGTTGGTGVQGADGAAAAQGIQGTQGIQGISGDQGVQGIQGSDANVQGIQGSEGPQGTTGSIGVQGAEGATGAQGFQGTAGSNGSQGIQGAEGALGSQGGQGIQGITGTGAQGTTGTQGTDGAAAAQGIQGVQGVQGDLGVQGSTGSGSQGTQGTQGTAGATGGPGDQGIQGITGDAGPQGIQGTDGNLGLQGSTGNQGTQGITGAGTQGTTGTQGVDGTQGNQGVQGTSGESASQGIQGIQGTAGGGVGGGAGYWEQTEVGINTVSNVGIATTNPQTTLQIGEVYGIETGLGSFTAVAGVAYTANSYSAADFTNAEYTLFFQHSSGIQSQKVLVMDDGSTAYSQEYGIMFSSDLLVSVAATVKTGNVELWWTPETGVAGVVTYRYTRETML